MLQRLLNLKQDKFLSKSLSTLIIRLLGVFFQFLILLLITNFFSEKIVGQFNYINTVLILLSSICLLGMNESFMQFSGKLEAEGTEDKIKQLYFKKVIILLFSFVVFLLLYLISSRIFKLDVFNDPKVYLFDKIFIALFFFSLSLLNFQAIRAIRKLFLSELFRNVVRYGAILLIVALVLVFDIEDKAILDSFIITFLMISLATTGFIIYFLNKIPKSNLDLKEDYTIKRIIKTSVPMSLSFISLLLMQSFDTIMIEHYLNIEQVAFYSVSVKVTFIVGIMQLTINSVIAPDISKFWFQNEKEKLRKLIDNSIKLNFIITLPLIILIVIFADQFLNLFGENYSNSKGALIILLVGQTVNSFSGSVGLYLNMTERQKILLKALVLAAVVNIILNLLLIPVYGIEGAAMSTSISLVLWNVICVVYVYMKDKMLLAIKISMFR